MKAVRNRNYILAELLLDRGAKVSVCDKVCILYVSVVLCCGSAKACRLVGNRFVYLFIYIAGVYWDLCNLDFINVTK